MPSRKNVVNPLDVDTPVASTSYDLEVPANAMHADRYVAWVHAAGQNVTLDLEALIDGTWLPITGHASVTVTADQAHPEALLDGPPEKLRVKVTTAGSPPTSLKIRWVTMES